MKIALFKLKAREKRMLVYLLLLMPVVAWQFWPRHWEAARTIETEHYVIASTATDEQTRAMAKAVEILYTAYREKLGTLSGFQTNHPKLKMILYKDRDELRRVNPGLGWAEAYYKWPFCRAYFSAEEVNPVHWMLHEAVHQLNQEAAHLHLEKWMEEGVADYFASSRIYKERLLLGTVDINTYPVWWIQDIATEPELARNLENGSVIPLRKIITNRGGPMMRTHVNLYYLHWWTLTHFVFEKADGMKMVEEGGTLKGFERIVGKVDDVQPKWHAHVRKLREELK